LNHFDLAKNVFQVHGIDRKEMLKKQLKRAQMPPFLIHLPPCLIGMGACGSAHHWERKLQAMGHTVDLIAPQFVKPYVKTNKNDAADTEAICEVVERPNKRFVPIKNVEQQAVLALHRVRQGRHDPPIPKQNFSDKKWSKSISAGVPKIAMDVSLDAFLY
jgi:transposase